MNISSRKLVALSLLALVAGAVAGCASKPAATEEAAPAATAAAPAATAPAPAAVDAQAQAMAAENQRMLNEARAKYDQARTYSGLNADQSARMREAEAAMASGDGRRAFDILNGLLAELAAAKMTYAVVKGDSLWGISGKPEVYGNPYQWPLIYKANTDKIRDADLIKPGQQLAVDKNPTGDAAAAAIKHAKTRGAWSVGAVEESDKAYAAGN
jgi:nucleoid-associated protein YgaU